MTNLFLIMLWYMVVGILMSNITMRKAANETPPVVLSDLEFTVCVIFFGLLWPIGLAAILARRIRLNGDTK